MKKQGMMILLAIGALMLEFALAPIPAFSGKLEPSATPGPKMKPFDQVEPRIPISSLPYTITEPGSYYITGNLSFNSGNGITIESDDVSIDLIGHTITGWDGGDCIYSIEQSNITIKNGTVRNCRNGILCDHTGYNIYGIEVNNIKAFSNLTGIALIARDSLIKNCIVKWSTNGGIYHGLTGGIIKGNIVSYSGGTGIYCGACLVIENLVNHSGLYGIRTYYGGLVDKNVVMDSTGSDISGTGTVGTNHEGDYSW